mmetsp:Transcript_102522/g.330837  ORF Transcript_102522/g.330837 Transcript_102522/m.330837 type:complete len:377 (-) Transcript_102522:11-1141(-)
MAQDEVSCGLRGQEPAEALGAWRGCSDHNVLLHAVAGEGVLLEDSPDHEGVELAHLVVREVPGPQVQVRLEVRRAAGLGHSRHALRHDVLQRQLDGRDVVPRGDGAGDVALQDLRVRVVRPRSVAQDAVGLRHDAVALAVAHDAAGVPAHAHVVHDLVHHREDVRALQAVEAAGAVVGHADSLGLARLVELHHRLPLLADHRAAARKLAAGAEDETLEGREVDDHQVHVREAQELQVLLQIRLCVLVAREGVPRRVLAGVAAARHLRLHEDLLPRHALGDRGPDGAADPVLVPVVQRGVQRGEAGVQRRCDGGLGHGAVVLVDACGEQWQLHAVAQRHRGRPRGGARQQQGQQHQARHGSGPEVARQREPLKRRQP